MFSQVRGVVEGSLRHRRAALARAARAATGPAAAGPVADATVNVLLRPRPRPRAPLRRRIITSGLWIVVVAFGFAYATSIAVPAWFDLHHQRLLIVTSGSMSGSGAGGFDAGDAVVMREISDPSQLKVGQVVSFWPAGSDHLVTHRIVSLHYLTVMHQDVDTGQMVPTLDPTTGLPLKRAYIVTKGDANNAPDPNATPLLRVRGVVLHVYPRWGWLLDWSRTPPGRFVLLAPPLAALAAMEIVALADARRTRGPRFDRHAPRHANERAVDDILLY